MNPDATAAVAFVCHPYHRGGVTRWMVDAAVEWSRAGYECWFVAPEPTRVSSEANARPAVIGLLRASGHFANGRLITARVGTAFELGTVAYRAAVYAHLLRTGLPPGIPVIVSDDAAVWAGTVLVSGRHPIIGVLHADEEKYYSLATRHARHIAAFVGVSNRVSARAKERVASRCPPIATIPCGVPVIELDDNASAEDRGAVRIAWVGRIQESQKRVSDIPRIASLLREAGQNVHVDIVGDGPDHRVLIDAVAAAGLTHDTTFHGWLPAHDVWRVLARSDVLLLPSNFEGMSVSVMEALMAGCPVVASRVSGIEDYEKHPLAANCLRAYAVGDVTEATKKIREVCAVPRGQRRSDARRFAVSEFSIERCAERYRSLIAGLSPNATSRPKATRLNLVGTASLSFPIAAVRAARRALR